MTVKWITLLGAWISVGTATSLCAFAWGADGRWTVLILGSIGFLVAGITTSNIATEPGRGKVGGAAGTQDRTGI